MYVTSFGDQLSLFSWNEELLQEGIARYKLLGYTLKYLKNELFSTKVGPFTTHTAIMEKPFVAVAGYR